MKPKSVGESVTERRDKIDIWLPLGAIGAIVLGIALIPLRTLTSASNLAFVFIAFTIVVAELGGRGAAMATAVVSAMSLNFFLTEPYLTLAITKSEDIVAFFAMAACGLIAAAFGRRRERLSEVAGRAGEDLDVLKRLVEQLRSGTPVEEILDDLRGAFGLRAIVLRDHDERVLAAAPPGAAPRAIPEARLTPDTLFASGETRQRFGRRGLRLPEGGGRLTLRTDQGTVSLDLWEGDTEGLDLDQGRTLAIAASMLGLELRNLR
jgi:hypothetical protein